MIGISAIHTQTGADSWNTLAIAILTALGLGGIMALRYAWFRTRDSLIVAAAIAAEVIVLGALVLILTTQLLFLVPWLDVDLNPPLKGAIAFLVVTSLLGACYLYVIRLEKAGHRIGGAVLFGAVTALIIGVLLSGIWAVQQSDNGLSRALNPFSEGPASTPISTPTPTPTPTPGPTDVITTLTRNPHLGECSTNSVTIAWSTDVPATSTVKYGPTPLMQFQQSNQATPLQHAITLNGLEPNTVYYYQVISNRQAMEPPGTFTTNMTSDESEFTFAVFGDSGVGGLVQFAMVSHLMDAEPVFLLHTGDIIYSHVGRAHLIEQGLLEGYEFNTVLDSWNAYYFLPYKGIISSKCMFTSIGNHDSQRDYQAKLHLPSNNPANSELYYSFDYGRAHIVSLQSNRTGSRGFSNTPQYRWLRTDLQEASQDREIDWIFVFFHHAPYASGAVGISPGSRGQLMAEVYVPVFEEFGVNVVFTGHDHAYERTCPIIKGACARPDEDGILYIVTGGGGHPKLADNECGSDCPWSEFRAAVHHFVKVSVQGDSLAGEAIDLDGNVIDTFAVGKSR